MIPEYGLSLVSAAATEPITTDEAKTQVRVTISDDDTEIDAFIASARGYVENYLGRRLVTQTWDIFFRTFPYGEPRLELPYGPIQSVTSISYIDTAGTTQTLSSTIYSLNNKVTPAYLYLSYGKFWPTVRSIDNAVTVRVVAGYGAYTDIPDNIRHAVKIIAASSYENRELAVPQVTSQLLAQEKATWL